MGSHLCPFNFSATRAAVRKIVFRLRADLKSSLCRGVVGFHARFRSEQCVHGIHGVVPNTADHLVNLIQASKTWSRTHQHQTSSKAVFEIGYRPLPISPRGQDKNGVCTQRPWAHLQTNQHRKPANTGQKLQLHIKQWHTIHVRHAMCSFTNKAKQFRPGILLSHPKGAFARAQTQHSTFVSYPPLPTSSPQCCDGSSPQREGQSWSDLCPPRGRGGGLHHTMVALKRQQFQCNLKFFFVRQLWHLVFPMLSGPSEGFGIRPWWLALLACGGPYWPLAFEPSAMTRRHPHCRGHPPSWMGIQNATSAHGVLP